MYHVCAELIEEDAVSSSDARAPISEDIPGETESRSEVIQVVVAQLAIGLQSGVAGKNDARDGVGTNGRLNTRLHAYVTAELLIPGQIGLIANAVRQSKSWLNFEFILNEEEVLPD